MELRPFYTKYDFVLYFWEEQETLNLGFLTQSISLKRFEISEKESR